MQKTVYLCDLCKKELPEEHLIEKEVDCRGFEVCEECSTRLDEVQKKLKQCREKCQKEMDAIIQEHGIDWGD